MRATAPVFGSGAPSAASVAVEPSGKGPSKFFRVPEATPADNADEARGLVKLAKDGAASLELDAKARGTWTAELRRSFESPDEFREAVQEVKSPRRRKK